MTATPSASPGSGATPQGPSATPAGGGLPFLATGVTRMAVVGPPGFTSRPAWAVPVAAWTQSVAADDGTVLTRDPEGHVLLLDPITGAARWRSPMASGSSQEGPWLATIDGVRVAAVVGGGVLSYWALPEAVGTAGTAGGSRATGTPAVPRTTADSGTGVRLPVGAKVTWVGPSPLVTMPTGVAGVVRAGTVVPVPLPAGAQALAADGSTVLAVTKTSFVRQSVGSIGTRPRSFPRPAGAGARPVRVEAVGSTLLLVVWPRSTGQGQIAGLVETGGGTLVVQTALAAGVDLTHAAVVRERAGSQTMLGSVLVDTYTANLDLLDPRYSVRTVTRGHAWAMFQGRATDVRIDRAANFQTVPFPAGDPALPVGVVASGPGRVSTAVVVAPFSGGWVLCGLPASAAPGTRS